MIWKKFRLHCSFFSSSTILATTTTIVLFNCLTLFCNQINALTMINLDVPSSAFQGETIRLSCSFELETNNKQVRKDLTTTLMNQNKTNSERQQNQISNTNSNNEDEKVYSIKWYKDDKEFYRHINDWPHKQFLPINGLIVDVDNSNYQTIVLKNISLKTSGLFKCEVSTDAPFFITKSIERQMDVYMVSNDGPVINGLEQRQILLNLGDEVNLSCSSAESKPAAQLDWIIASVNVTNFFSTVKNKTLTNLFKVTNKRKVKIDTSISMNDDSAIAAVSPFFGPTLYRVYSSDTSSKYFELPNSDINHNLVQLNFLKSIHHMPEVSVSNLHFVISNELIQLLGNTLQKHDSQKNSIQPPQTRTVQSHFDAISQSRSNSSFDEVKISNKLNNSKNYARSSAKQKSQTDSLTITIVIKCVARVLHLTMSDELKVRVIWGRNKFQTRNKLNKSLDNINEQKQEFSSQMQQDSRNCSTLLESSLIIMIVILSFLYILLPTVFVSDLSVTI